jgi:hypothetical protein
LTPQALDVSVSRMFPISRSALFKRRLGELHHVLELLQRADLDDVAGWLGLEHRLLAGERIDAFAGWRGGLLLHDDLAQARNREGLGTLLAEGLGDFVVECVEDSAHVLLGQAGCLGNAGVDFGFGRWFFSCNFCHVWKPSIVLWVSNDARNA